MTLYSPIGKSDNPKMVAVDRETLLSQGNRGSQN